MASQPPRSHKPDRYHIVRLLQAIRDRQVSGWEGLNQFRRANNLPFIRWGSSYAKQPPPVIFLLQELQRAGLVEVEGIDLDSGIWVHSDSSKPVPKGVVVYNPLDASSPSPPPELAIDIRISPAWQGIQDTLGISLTWLAELQDAHAMVVIPTGFPETSQTREYADIFVVMPFRQELERIYRNHIVRACGQLSCSVSRADDFFGVEAVMAYIWNAMRAAKLIIADCTDRSANVFYEIGLAHVLGKPVLLLSQHDEDVPFDIRHLRFIKYSDTPTGMKNLEEAIKATLSGIL
jgi:hypothetical protein